MLLNKSISFLIFFYLLNNIFLCESVNELTDEEKEQALIRKILKNYSKKQKPSGTVSIKFALNLNQIVNIKAKDQVFMLNVFLDHEWVDDRLSWDPEQNGNISILRISCEYLWTPDTFIYTTADNTGFLLPQKGAYFVVASDGKIFWPNPLPQMKVRCSMSIAWFPYDEQLCIIVFGSWSHTVSYLNYTMMNEESALAGYQENSEWSMVSYKGFRNEIKYDNWVEDDSFSEIHYKILISRKPLFVLQNYCIPAVMLCIITLCSFFMPFPQEMQLGISVMLTFSILKLKLSDDVPAQSDSIPLFNIYFTGCMVFSLLSILWFNQMNIYRNKNKMPTFCRWVVLRYVCFIMRTPDHKIIQVENMKNIIAEINDYKEKEKSINSNESSDGNKYIDETQYENRSSRVNKSIKSNGETNIMRSASFFTLRPFLQSKEAFGEENIIREMKIEPLPEFSNQRVEYTDMEILPILNHFIFWLFVTYISLLNISLLVLGPYLFKTSLQIIK